MHHRPRFKWPTHDWQPADRTGGPLDGVLDELRRQHPDLWVERLKSTHSGEDDVYFIGTADLRRIVQVDTGPDGHPPFTIEDDDRADTSGPAEALNAITARLRPTQ